MAKFGLSLLHALDQRCGRQVDHTFLRAQPAQLPVVGQAAPEAAHVVDDGVEVTPHDERRQLIDGCAAQVVAAADGEGEPVSFVFTVGVQHDVGDRVVGVLMDGVGAGQGQRCPCSQVVGAMGGDLGHALGPASIGAPR